LLFATGAMLVDSQLPRVICAVPAIRHPPSQALPDGRHPGSSQSVMFTPGNENAQLRGPAVESVCRIYSRRRCEAIPVVGCAGSSRSYAVGCAHGPRLPAFLPALLQSCGAEERQARGEEECKASEEGSEECTESDESLEEESPVPLLMLAVGAGRCQASAAFELQKPGFVRRYILTRGGMRGTAPGLAACLRDIDC
jgi:hypothetical protein